MYLITKRLQPLSYATDFIKFFNIKNKNQIIANMFFFQNLFLILSSKPSAYWIFFNIKIILKK